MNNQQWLMIERPNGMVSEQHFTLTETKTPLLREGEVLIKTLMLSFDPAMRGWMDDKPSYLPPVAINEPMRASGIGQVVESNDDALPVGTLVQGILGWQEYSIAGPNSLFPPSALPSGTPPNIALSVLGATSLTAYFGLLKIGDPQPGETVLISGAAGATGSAAAQIAKLKGARVIGIAGGKDKCDWLLGTGIDAVIDYKSENIRARLSETCPDGIHVFFDNVGGDTLEAAIEHAADFARFVLCGSISNYNDDSPKPGPNNMFSLIAKRIRMQGFIMFDYMAEVDSAMADLVQWLTEGKLLWREDIKEGFDNIPKTFIRLFEGKNQGKQLLKLADPN
ncbi:MAG: NADP-dependent oxidoreductase [Actinobacteria bacterium TMED172]|nr:NADP-dependent oxidoreductase [Cellvibrionales bacterium]OUW33306.1 MAG: NADP-dependent oxidoreductase [Actinobacteria bacterium TMED172]|tara:strand:- start:3564 stop:4574 length:1011 start_codon:yes stop_codon:yes gene_type:complete